jgi:hypothetical protein
MNLFVVVVLHGLLGETFAASRAPCGTMALLDATLAQPFSTDRPPPPPPSADKTEREAHGTCAHVERTENFAFKWGNSLTVDPVDVAVLAEEFEFIWAQEVGVMGHGAPWGSESTLMNVYIGDTGSCAPSVLGNAGYYTLDAEGWPMIVMSYGSLSDAVYGKSTAAHEFYHAVQHASDAFTEDDARWFWEATACWVEDEVYPMVAQYAVFLFGYAFQPHHQLNAFTYPSAGRIEEYHQYGAFIFPRFLSEHRADWTVIRDAWMESEWSDDPLDAIASLLPDEDLEVLFADFAAHNATWDYADGPLFEVDLDYYADHTTYGADDFRIADTVSGQGTEAEWQAAPEDTLPERFGYNIIALNTPAHRVLTLRFEGDAAGSQGSEARYQVRLVRDFGGGSDITEIPVVDWSAEVNVGDVGDEDALFLVVAAFSDDWNTGETFAYRYQFDMGNIVLGGGDAPVEPPGMKGGEGCGCGTLGRRGMAWVLIYLSLAVGWTRRSLP